MTERSIYVSGCADELRSQLSKVLSVEIGATLPSTIEPGDLVFLGVSSLGASSSGASSSGASAANSGDVPHGNAFAACRSIKRQHTGIRVFLVLPIDDDVSEEIARFCLADGCVRVDAGGALCSAEQLAELVDPVRRTPPVDSLLARLESRLGDGASNASAFQKMVQAHESGHFMDRLTDAETGLFDGPFASFKLDEEFKRAQRFHQPLSLILLDCGTSLPDDENERRMVLAEMASVFLNECRDIDTIGRFTETVFMFLLPGTGADGAARVARRMLDGLQSRDYAVEIEVDPAAGIVTAPMTGVTRRADFLGRAEACLELARTDRTQAGLCAL